MSILEDEHGGLRGVVHWLVILIGTLSSVIPQAADENAASSAR